MKLSMLFEENREYIAVDFDGTLATTAGDPDILGEPIAPMVARVKRWLKQGKCVKILTARAAHSESDIKAIKKWCKEHLGRQLPVTCKKDKWMKALYDDKAVAVQKNTGKLK